MVGEQMDGGTRINYVTDALGSIVQAIATCYLEASLAYQVKGKLV
jgi:hypothetical protein